MLTQDDKQKVIDEHKVHDKDTGSVEVQIAILTEEIDRLLRHFAKHKKDNHSRKGLLGMVARRRRLLKYLYKEDEQRYAKLIKQLGLKK